MTATPPHSSENNITNQIAHPAGCAFWTSVKFLLGHAQDEVIELDDDRQDFKRGDAQA